MIGKRFESLRITTVAASDRRHGDHPDGQDDERGQHGETLARHDAAVYGWRSRG
jgi:hypothetical protein